MSMDENKAATMADKILWGMIENQELIFGNGYLTSVSSAQNIAKAVAAFRLQLIEELKNQPE